MFDGSIALRFLEPEEDIGGPRWGWEFVFPPLRLFQTGFQKIWTPSWLATPSPFWRVLV